MNYIVRTIIWNKKFFHVTHMHKKLNYLKLNDIYHLELAKFMHKICNNKLLLVFQQRFNKIELVHSHQTRKLTNLNYFFPRVSKTAGQKKKKNFEAPNFGMKSMKILNIKRLIPSKNVLKKKLYHIIDLVLILLVL